MDASVLLFGITRDHVGQSAIRVPLPEGASVADLVQVLRTQYPPLQQLRSLLVAVNGAYADDSQYLNPNDEIALIPPVSGG